MESPASYDPRGADVAAVTELLDRVTRTGKVAKLPTMGTVELCALGALSHPLLDDEALAWWTARPDPEAAASRGYDHMAGRDLIDPATGRIHPQLGVILAARSRPAFIVILHASTDGEPLPGRFLGIADETAGLRAVLSETAVPVVPGKHEESGPLYAYELSGPAVVSRYLAEFAATGKHQSVIDFYQPGSGTPLPSQRFTVSRSLRRLRVEWTTPHTAPQRRTASEEELDGLLLDAMAGASS